MTQLARRTATNTIARPLKILVPLIQSELHAGNRAGAEHFRKAGEMLIEAKEQIARGGWGRWLTKNFALSDRTAREYMQTARAFASGEGFAGSVPTSKAEVTGQTERARAVRAAARPFLNAVRDVDREEFVQERQARADEITLHRDLAAELIDLGYRALATRLHPDRGGSKDAMSRLNRVRDELKEIATTRRFV